MPRWLGGWINLFVRDTEHSRILQQVEKDSEVLNLMLMKNEAASKLLRDIVYELQMHPGWDASSAGREKNGRDCQQTNLP